VPDKAPLNAAGYYRGLRDLMTGVTSTSGEIDEETGLLVGWDEPPYTMVLETKPVDDELDREMRLGGDR
jgi:hypothetical protein